MASELREHVERWRSGCGSCLCPLARKIVHVRGTVPCDVAFVGEAPGDSEDSLGVPFVGPAGRLQDRIIAEAFAGHPGLTWAFCNLVGCFPLEAKREGSNEPDAASIKQCRPRLVELLRILRPRMIVNVGNLSKKWLPDQSVLGTVDWLPEGQAAILFSHHTHPAAILKGNVISKDMMIRRCVVTLVNALQELKHGVPF